MNYVQQWSADPAPPAMRLLAQDDDVALYGRSDAMWAAHRALRPATPAGSQVYEVPRGILFRSVSLPNGPPILDVSATFE